MQWIEPQTPSDAHSGYRPAAPASAGSLVVATVIGVVFVLGAVIVFQFPAHHDIAWILYMASRALNGATLYRDVVEVNPPLIVFFSLPAALLARLTGAWDVALYRIMVLAMAAASLIFSARIARKLYPDRPVARGTLLIGAAFAFALLDTLQFGQREHIALVLLLPYVLLAACRASAIAVGRRAGIAAGVMAGIGLAFKPHFVVPWLAVEVYVQLTRPCTDTGAVAFGRLALPRPETAGIVAAGVGYVAAIVAFTPEFFGFAAYTAETYGGYGGTGRWLLITRIPAVRIITALSAAALLTPPWVGHGARARQALAITTFGFLLAAIIQGKGWTYHWVPAYGFAVIAAAAALADAFSAGFRRLVVFAPRSATLTRGSAAAIAAPILILAAMMPWVGRQQRVAEADRARVTHASNRLPELLAVVDELGEDGPIAALSLNMQTAFPLVNYASVSWGLRLPALWPLPALYPPVAPDTARYPFRAPDRMSAAEKLMFDWVVQDLVSSRPTLIIVDRQPRYGLHGFDFLAYFGQDAAFRRLLLEYEPAATVERYLIMRRTEQQRTKAGRRGASQPATP